MSPRRRLDDDVPRLPRGRGLKLKTPQVIQLVMVATALVAVILLAKPCSQSVSRFVTSFGDVDAGVPVRTPAARTDAGPATSPASGEVTGDGVMLRGDMTSAELEAAIERARTQAGPSLDADGDASAPLDAGVPDAR